MSTCPHCAGEISLKTRGCAHCGDVFAVVARRGHPPAYCSMQCKNDAAAERHNVSPKRKLRAV